VLIEKISLINKKYYEYLIPKYFLMQNLRIDFDIMNEIKINSDQVFYQKWNFNFKDRTIFYKEKKLFAKIDILNFLEL
jgi:hypothetical protein